MEYESSIKEVIRVKKEKKNDECSQIILWLVVFLFLMLISPQMIILHLCLVSMNQHEKLAPRLFKHTELKECGFF